MQHDSRNCDPAPDLVLVQVNIPACLLLRRSAFFTDTGISHDPPSQTHTLTPRPPYVIQNTIQPIPYVPEHRHRRQANNKHNNGNHNEHNNDTNDNITNICINNNSRNTSQVQGDHHVGSTASR